jgi:hypothetical protein
MSQDQLYNLYCQYSSDVKAAGSIEPTSSICGTLTEPQFTSHWNSISDQEKEHWRSRFEAGYTSVQASETSRISSALFPEIASREAA